MSSSGSTAGTTACANSTRALIDACWRGGGTIFLSAVSAWEIALLVDRRADRSRCPCRSLDRALSRPSRRRGRAARAFGPLAGAIAASSRTPRPRRPASCRDGDRTCLPACHLRRAHSPFRSEARPTIPVRRRGVKRGGAAAVTVRCPCPLRLREKARTRGWISFARQIAPLLIPRGQFAPRVVHPSVEAPQSSWG